MKLLERSALHRNDKKPRPMLEAAGGAAVLALGTVAAITVVLIAGNAPHLGEQDEPVEPVAVQVSAVPAAAPPSTLVPASPTLQTMPSEGDLMLLSYAPHGG